MIRQNKEWNKLIACSIVGALILKRSDIGKDNAAAHKGGFYIDRPLVF